VELFECDENKEIIFHIEKNIDMVLNDPMILFYCLYFTIFYNNEELLKKIRDIIIYYRLSTRRWGVKSKLNHLPKVLT